MKVLVLVVLTLTFVIGCTGSSGQNEATPEEYIAQFVEGLSLCEAEPDPVSIEDLLDEAEALLQLFENASPPSGVVEAHEAYASALKELVDGLRDFESLSAIRDDPEFVELVTAGQKAHENWNDAIEQAFGVRLFTNEGASMEPAFTAGDAFAFDSFDGNVERWDLIVFEYPLDPERTFFKRVVGLPGETVEVRNDAILIDGVPIVGDEYALADTNYEYGPRVVPADSYFVLGDNRRNSFDSHAWGSSCRPEENCDFVPAAAILGELPPETVGEFCDDADATATPTGDES